MGSIEIFTCGCQRKKRIIVCMGALKSPKCSKGHRLAGKNLYQRSNGQRECRKCSLARNAKWKRNSKPIARKTSLRKKRGTPRKVSVVRDAEFRKWLREKSCVVCRHEFDTFQINAWEKCHSTECAHIGPTNGMGSKGDDRFCLPLGRKHHRELHRIGMKDFNAKYGIDLRKIVETSKYYERFKESRNGH